MGLVYDCFTFFNEVDLLALRLEELYPVVDKFIIVESDTTFRGNPKPLNFLDNREMFAVYEDKIIYHPIRGKDIVFSGAHPKEHNQFYHPWEREYWQRNAILTVLRQQDAQPDDIIVVSDLDEIPRRANLQELLPQASDKILDLAMDVYCYGINIKTHNVHTIKVFPYSLMSSPQAVRTTPAQHYFPDCGWEFSSMGTPETISYKLQNFSHWELDVPAITSTKVIKKHIESLTDMLDGRKFERAEIDETWPEAVKNNRDYWKKYEW